MVVLFTLLLIGFTKYRIPTGPIIEGKSQIRHQVIDLGWGEENFRLWVIEPVFMNSRLWLSEGPIEVLYVPTKTHAELFPSHHDGTWRQAFTFEITYQVRKLRFAKGFTIAKVTSVRKIDHSPNTTK